MSADNPDKAGDLRQQYRLFGRHKGHQLKPRQARLIDQLLPELRLDCANIEGTQPARLFAGSVKAVWLEIGFGGGEHLVWQAERNPDVGIVGCEPFVNGIAKLLAEVETKNLSNVRILDDDVRPLLERLPDHSIERIFLLYPDPWPKTRHHKRRMINQATLSQFHRLLTRDGELRVASDIPGYVRWTLAHARQFGKLEWIAEGPGHWRKRPDDWPTTRYEQKALQAGRTPAYLTFRPIG